MFARMRIKPEEGMEVVASGKITTFPGKSNYQIVVETIEPAGVGALLALLEARRKALAAEGLFDAARKRPLPALPRVIGVVTSPTGAVIRDILHRIAERFPLHVLVWPVRVQGEGSAKEIAAAIAGFNALAPGGKVPRPDVLIVARGGGSLEDLWSFNEEIVVRAAAASQIPLISAVGHETDVTLIDHAADLRAPTPTAAAEIATPLRSQLLADLEALRRRALAANLRTLEGKRASWRAAARAFPSPEDLLAIPRQRLDRAATSLGGQVRARLALHQRRMSEASRRLARQSPLASLARSREREGALGLRLRRAFNAGAERNRQRLHHAAIRLQSAKGRSAARREEARILLTTLARRLDAAFRRGLETRGAKLASLAQVFAAVNYRSVLARGFALVKDEAGMPIRAAADVGAEQALRLEFADGEIRAQAVAGNGAIVGQSKGQEAQRGRPGHAVLGACAVIARSVATKQSRGRRQRCFRLPDRFAPLATTALFSSRRCAQKRARQASIRLMNQFKIRDQISSLPDWSSTPCSRLGLSLTSMTARPDAVSLMSTP